MLVDTHVARLSVPVDDATHVVLSIVVTESGNELTLCETEVDVLLEVLVPNSVAVGLGLHAICVARRRVTARQEEHLQAGRERYVK